MRRTLCFAAVSCLLALTPAAAAAQTGAELLTTTYILNEDEDAHWLFTSTTSAINYGPLITIGGAISVGGVLLTTYLFLPESYPVIVAEPDEQQRALIRGYLRIYKQRVLEAQMLGAGDAVEDLSALFGVRRALRPVLGRAMRLERVQLAALLNTPCEATCDALADRWITVTLRAVERSGAQTLRRSRR